MERIEFPARGDVERMVDAVERGDEVVLTRDGRVVAEVKESVLAAPHRTGEIDWEALRRLHDSLPEGLRGRGAATIQELRDSYRY